jgi:arylsulfatase A-like enzyme
LAIQQYLETLNQLHPPSLRACFRANSRENRTGAPVTETPDMNILFLSIEDLNDWIEPLGGHPDTRTPNFTRLASRAMLFENAYAEAPACSPSRTATLFGQHPWSTGVYANNHKWHDYYQPGAKRSLVGRLKDAGFETHGAGKVFHVEPNQFDSTDWTSYNRRKVESFDPISKTRATEKISHNSDFGPIDDAELLFDDYNTAWMVDKLQTGATGQFWALGLYRPHLPFVVQQKYFDRFPGEISDPPGLGLNRFDPKNESLHSQIGAAGQSLANDSRPLRRALARNNEYKDFLKAYLASINYADALLGKVLDQMDACNLWYNTLVVLWSDHGWQLGEKLAFRKFTLWERALRVPMMFAGPDITPGRSTEPVTLTDIAPTLFARAGLPIPTQFEGQDISPTMGLSKTPLRGNAVSVWGRDFKTDSPRLAMSARSPTHRYILYWDGSEELYDHQIDPFEHNNLLKNPTTDPTVTALREAHQLMLPEDFAEPVKSKANRG